MSMPTTTSIKVPTALRDRLAARARRTNTTLAGALARALDESEEQEFWSAVRQAHARPDAAADPDDLGPATLRDDLRDDADDALGRHGW